MFPSDYNVFIERQSQLLITLRQNVCKLGSDLGISRQHISCEKYKRQNTRSVEMSLRHNK